MPLRVGWGRGDHCGVGEVNPKQCSCNYVFIGHLRSSTNRHSNNWPFSDKHYFLLIMLSPLSVYVSVYVREL